MDLLLNRSARLQRTSGLARHTTAIVPLAAILLSLLSGYKQQEHHAPDVWAVVNGVEIKRDEVEKYYKSRINPEASQETSPEEILSGKLNVVEQLINNEILLERAKKLNLEEIGRASCRERVLRLV